MTDRQTLIKTFLRECGWEQSNRVVLAGDASFRRYDRVTHTDGRVAVLMDAPPPMENVVPFLTIADHLAHLGFSAPTILGRDIANGLLLLEDLGDATYTRLLAAGQDETRLYQLATDALIALNRHPQALAVQAPPYDDDRLLAEAALLPDWYMPAMGISPDPHALAQYRLCWQAVLPLARRVPDTLILRDFHVDNLLLLDRPGITACGLLDFQDAVQGPLTYDLMSLLEDARRDIAPPLIQAMKDRYLAAFPHLERNDFETSWAVMAAVRHAKVIGIFTRLCRRDGKPHYLVHIPRVWRLLEQAVAHPALTPVKDWLDRHIAPPHRGIPCP